MNRCIIINTPTYRPPWDEKISKYLMNPWRQTLSLKSWSPEAPRWKSFTRFCVFEDQVCTMFAEDEIGEPGEARREVAISSM